ncbi:hypothetical protein ACQKPC_00410 [Pseudomonas sp. NPDC089918]|uniref:hypothetical protein n=1 Tax=Pseudomonas sp. NPDC089918 TaxID=3390654 RepID=UPI0030F0C053
MAEELSMVVRCSDESAWAPDKNGLFRRMVELFLQAKRTPRLAGFLYAALQAA